jgi:Ca2+:H+ antiporter
VPVALALHFAHVNDTVVFVTSGLAIVPLAALLGFATEQIAMKIGDTLGGLLNATFGNAVELIIAIL